MRLTLNWNDPMIDKEIRVEYTRSHGEIDLDSIEIFRRGFDYTKAFERLSALHGDLWDDLKDAMMDNEHFEMVEELSDCCGADIIYGDICSSCNEHI